jgi:hypothetical protein
MAKPQQDTEPNPYVYVLVKTSESEGGGRHYEIGADTDLVGTYRTREVAEKAKRWEIREGGYESSGNGDDTYSQGDCYNTTFKVFKQTIIDSFSDEDEEDESEEDESEEDESEEEV